MYNIINKTQPYGESPWV